MGIRRSFGFRAGAVGAAFAGLMAAPPGLAHASDGPAAPAAASPAVGQPAADAEETAGFKADVGRLEAGIRRLENDTAQLVELNRTRMRLAITLAQRAIVLLRRRDVIDPASFDDATSLIQRAESVNTAVDVVVLNEDDRRVYSDLQALIRKAIAEQVTYLRRWIQSLPAHPSPPATHGRDLPVDNTPTPTDPIPVYPVMPTYPVYQPMPCNQRPHRPMFRLFRP